ncbi:titin-like isoform X4 [Scylla paramamosain]|uniref:titin-like isoform X4 n=1 Tax=Scylla paramamosain TaxID=85552 RepID=UPI0030828468
MLLWQSLWASPGRTSTRSWKRGKRFWRLGVTFHTKAQQYSDSMDAAERAYTDNVMPNDAEEARQLLSLLHDHKRAVLEASMHTLQEAQTLLGRLRNMTAEGATLDSRPLQIRTNIDFACSQIEHYLESLHDRRRFLDGLFAARKHHLEQCLALCLLYQDLTEAVSSLKQLRDEVSQHQSLGDSQSNAEILLHEHLKREAAAKEQQDKCIHLLKTAEDMASGGHYAGLEARSRAYSVLEAATALHETCDTRTALLQQAILFFKLAQTALTKLDQAEVQVVSMGGEGAQRLSLVVGVVEEAVQPALTEGYGILEVTGGKNQPHNMGISQLVDELERRRAQLSSTCVSSTEQVLQRTELSNAFLEQHNAIESWLVRIGDAFLQGHQDPGGSLSLAKDFLHLHQTLNRDVVEKKGEIDSLATFLEKLLPDLSLEEGAGFKDKLQALYDHWEALRKLLDARIGISEKYVKFHEDAEALNGEFESFELLLKEAKGEDDMDLVEAKWEQLQKHYLDLCNTGKAFCQEAKNVNDPYLDTNRAILCVENILDHLGKRRLVITDLHSHFHMKLTTTKEMTMLFNTYRDNIRKMQKEMAEMENSFCPLLRGDCTDPDGMATTLEERLNIYVSAVKKTQDDIQEMMTRAEVMSYKGDEPGQRDEVIGSLLQLYQSLQNKATEYQILGHMLIQWCRNIAEIHRSCDKLENQFDAVSLDIGGVEAQLREHDASKQAVAELLKFAQNEADSIMSKIKNQCPPEAGALDIATMEELLVRRGRDFDVVWTQHQKMLERQLKRSQYHVDLQVISDQLRDLSEQLSRMRGHYGDSLAAATSMQGAFNQFEQTVDALEKRIQSFVSTTTKMLGPEDDSGEVKEDLAELEKKWSTFQMQVGQAKKSIELSIVFFKLVDEAEDWFKQGTNLLVEVAGETVNIKNPEQAEYLRSRIEHFLKPGEEAQQERITHIASLAQELYGDAVPKPVEVMSHQNTQIVESLTVIMRNLNLMVENLKAAEDLNETQKKEKEELAASLAAAQAEAEAARLAALAAEEARRAAEEAAEAMAIPIEPIVPEKVEIEIQTEAIPLPPEEEAPKKEESPPLKKAKMIDEEPEPMAPVFLTPLVGATVTEGVKFTFECRVLGMPMPEVEWLKDSRPVTDNPDYKTSYEEGVCTLTIEETFTEDSALFICRAVNGAGIAETSATLTVKEAEPVEVLSPPTFTHRLEDTSTQEGSSFQLEATVEGNPLPTVSWSKNGTCIDESPDYVITFNNGECLLRFEEVFLEDEADYTCRATNDLGEDTTKARLTVTAMEVTERPKFTMPLSNVMARAGQKFKLECQVTGLPTPTVTWFHNNKPVKETPDCKITFDGSVATLVMAEAFPKNAGMYTVVAKNSAGEGKCSANVSVKGRIPTETSDSEVTSDVDIEPVKPSVQLALKDTTVTEGHSARLDCVIVGQPEPEVIWYHDDTPVKESSDFKLLFHGDRCSLVIHEAYLEDAGIYRVVAVNSAGEASTACFLNVDPAPELPPPPPAPEQHTVVAPRFSLLPTDQHVVEGKPVTLRAAVTGHPRPTVAWYKDSMPLQHDNDLQIHESSDGSLSLTVHATTLDHTGQYEVVASNSAGTAKSVAYLSIEPRLPTPPPTDDTEPPVFTKLLNDTVVTAGNSVKFEAEVTGVPAPTITWTLNDCPITGQEYQRGHLQYVLGGTGNKHTLEVPVTSMMQAGRIAIIAENPVGKAVSAAALKVVEPLVLVTEAAMPQHVREESHVSTTSSTSTSFKQSMVVESSSFTRVVTSDGVADEKKHSTTSAASSQVHMATGQPTLELHSARLQEVKQEGDAPPVISDKISMIKKEGEVVTQEISQDTGAVPLSPPPQQKKIMAAKKRSSPARFVSPMQGVITKEDNQVVLECVIDGHPEPAVTWTHNGGPLSNDAMVETRLNKTVLTIPKVKQSHSGHYTCFIENDAGSAQCTCDVIVKKTQFPPVISKRLQPRVLGVNERLHLEIDVTGTPSPTITWSKDGQPLTPSDRVALKSEGTRHILVIQQAEPGDSGRYGVMATNAAGRAESLADVMVTPLVMDKAPPTHKIAFTDISDDAKKTIETQEEGLVKTIKRTIEEVAVEAPSPASPLKIQKAPAQEPSVVEAPSDPQAPPPEPILKEEVEVRSPPGKLSMVWPPPPTESENVVPKIDTSVEITSANVSSIISSFSAMGEEQEYTSHAPPREISRPQQAAQIATAMDVDLQPEPAPEYGVMADSEPQNKSEPQPEEPSPVTVEESLVPEPQPVFQVMPPETPAFTDTELQVMEEYQRIQVPKIETHKVLSPVPEVIPEPAPSPEPPISQQVVTVEETRQESPPSEPQKVKEVKTETSTIETNIIESKKSMSKTSYSVVETKMYTTGGVTSPIEEAQGVSTSTVVVDSVVQPVMSEVVAVPEPMVEARAEPIIVDDLMQYYVPESEQVIECVPAPKPAEPPYAAPPQAEQVYSQKISSKTSSFMSMKSESKTAVLEEKLDRKPLQPLIMPEPLSSEPPSGDESVRPPKPPEKDDGRESRKPRRKRESVIQIAKRLEENIVPMSPDEVPGGIRMFPSPKQPSTPVPTTPTKEVIEPVTIVETTSLEKFPQLEPFPFTVEEKPRQERPKSLPPPKPSKFIPGAFTDSEYESDMEPEHRFKFKKIKFEVPERAPRSQSAGKEPLPPSAFDTPPVIDSLRPAIPKEEEKPVIKKEEPKPKPTFAPKKSKIVQKFLTSAGESAEKEVVKPIPKKPKVQETVSVQPTVQVKEQVVKTEIVHKPEKLVKVWPPKQEQAETKQTSVTSSFETRTQITSVSHHTQVSKVSSMQQQSMPEPVVLVPEPAPEYVVPPPPEPVVELQPEPEPVYEVIPEPQPVLEPVPEPEPPFELKPAPPPVYETIPEPAPVVQPKPIPKFKPVQAPLARPSPAKPSAPAPPPPFDLAPPVPQPVIVPTQASVSQKVEQVSSTKKVESTVSSSMTKSFKVQKQTRAWPPAPQEEAVTAAPMIKTRSLSAERPRVTEPVVLPPWSQEAPAIYWTSSVKLEEKTKPWTPPTAVTESIQKTTKEETTHFSKQMSETMRKEVKTQQFVRELPKIKPKKEIQVAAPPPPPPVEAVVGPPIPMPSLEPFPFKVSPERERKPRGAPPPMPKKFVPGSFTESEYESDYDSKSEFSRLYMSDSETSGFRPMNLKMKKGRTRRPKQASPPAPTTFGPPPPFEVKPMCVSFSDIESDFLTSRESTPIPESKVIQTISESKVVQRPAVHDLKTLASEILPENKPIRIAQSSTKQTAVTVTSKPAPIMTPRAAPPAPVVVPQPEPPAPLLTSATSETVTKKEVKEVTSESQVQMVEKQEKGVREIKKRFDVSGPPPMPQGITASVVRMQSPSPVRPEPAGIKFAAPTGVSPVQPPAPKPAPAPSAAVVTNIPVVQEFSSVEKTSSSSTTRTKPTSPKAKKKTEATQMVVQEMEESGYAADTEGTLPRRSAKTAQSMSSSFSSNTSFVKSESFMSSSFSSESKSFSSSQTGNMEASSFPMGSGFPSSNGLATDSFPFPTHTPPVGQTTQFSSSCKSSESKSSQMFSSRSEETREERRGGEHPKTKAAPPPQQEKKPKFEEFRRESHGKPGSSGPFSEDTFYSMRDESDEVTDGTRTKKKVEFQTETHVEVMSDKKVEVFETSSVNVTPQPAKKQTFRQEQKVEQKIRTEPKVDKTHHISRITKHVRETPKQVPRDTSSETSKIKIEVIDKESHKAKMATQVKAAPKPKPEEVSQLASRPQVKFEKKPQVTVIKEPKVEVHPKVPIVEPLKSTGLVKLAVTRQEEKKEELNLKPFPFKPDPEKPKKPRGPPPSKPSKFVKGEFLESDYESDYEGRPVPKWKPADSDGEDQIYGTVRAPHDKPKIHRHHVRTPTPPTVFDKPPEYEGPPRPKIDFPESEPEVEREITPEVIIPDKVEDVKPLPKIVPKEGKIFKSQPKRAEPPPRRSPSPVLTPGSPPVEGYAPPPKRQPPPPQEQPAPPQPQPQPSRFSNAVGVESTKITKIADSSQHHQRFVTMQQTTRVIKFSDSRTGTSTTETQEIKVPQEKPKVVVREEHKEKPLPPLEPFPFTPEPDRQKKPRGAPPPMPKKFRKGEFTESDYDSDYEGRVRPKWQPLDSDTEDPSYARVKPQLHSDRIPSKSRERIPTPPTQFDTPPEAGGPWRPKVEVPPPPPPVVVREPSPELVIPKEPPKKIETVKKVAKVAKKVVKVEERAPSPPLPPPGTPPEIGVIEERTEYVVDRVDLKSRVIPPPMQEVQTYEEKPFTKVLERTEKTITRMKMEEELRMKKEKKEIKKTTVTEYEPISMPQPVQPQVTKVVEKQLELEPFPFEPEPSKPRRERGPPPPKPKKFVKGEFRESDYDSDFESRMRPKWKPADSDVEDPEYTPVRPPPSSDRRPSRSKERTPTPPTQFEVPPSGGGPLRPTIEPIERPVLEVKEPSPEVVILKITEKPLPKTKKVVPKAPSIRQQEPPPPPPPRSPTPPLPEPEPQPEIGYAPAHTKHVYEEKEDVHIKMIKKKIESKKGVQIDIDITDVYDLISESEQEKTEPETSKAKPFPKLEPFPYTPEPGRPKRMRGPPPPQPKKFLKGEFRGSDYESDYDSHIAPKWVPPDSEGEEFAYRRVAPPASETARHREESSTKEPSPPSKFDQPPQFEGPPRPVVDLSDLPRRERRESLEEYSIPRFPKVEFKPFDLEDEQVRQPKGAVTTDTETESEFQQTDIDKKYVKSAQKVVSHQFEDMTQTFRHKAQKFAEQLVTEVFAAREGSVPAEPAGEPPSLPEELKTQPPTSEAPPKLTTTEDLSSLQEPQAYRDESRVSEFGTKHIDPDTGLIYFKYDFGYEFGVILPGEAKKIDKKSQMNGDHSSDMPIPIIHEKTDASKKTEKQTPQANGHVQHLETTHGREHSAALSDAMPKGSSALGSGTDHLSPHPSQQSDISETDLLGSPLSATPPSTPSTPCSGPLTQPTRPPQYITPLRDLSVAAGEALRLECVVQADPPVQVTWAKGGDILQNGPDYQIVYRNGVCRLIIPHVFPDDEGVYSCTAVNLLGMDTTSATVCITGEKK